MRIVVIGASGNAGSAIARLLARELGRDDELVLAGRAPDKLATTASMVDQAAGRPIARTERIDAGDERQIRTLVEGARLVVMTASVPHLVPRLARAAMEAGADWFDTLLSGKVKRDGLRTLAPEISRRGLCFVTDGGFHPGLPAAMVRWAAKQVEHLERAEVFAALRIDWKAGTLAPSTIDELLDEFMAFDMKTLIDGERRILRMTEMPKVDFGEPIGSRFCLPMPLDEMDNLPHIFPSLRTAGFFIAGFHPVMDWGVLPVIMAMNRIPPLRSAAARLLRWSLDRLGGAEPPHALVIRLDAHGRNDGKAVATGMTIRGDDGYFVTAVPAVACIRRMLDGSARRPGLWHQAYLVPPDIYFEDVRSLGLDVAFDPVTGAES